MFLEGIVPYTGIGFWTVMVVFIALNRFAEMGRSRRSLRNVLMIAISFLVVASVMDSPYMAIGLIMVSVLVHFVGYVLLKGKMKQGRVALGTGAILAIVCLLCYFKYSAVQATVNHVWKAFSGGLQPAQEHKHLFFVGVSYFSFKFIHFLVECYKGKLKDVSLLTSINYIFFFPSFFSGPINRYGNFIEDIKSSEPTKLISKNSVAAIQRVVTGMFKKVVLANNLLPYTIVSLDPCDVSLTKANVIMGVYAYMFYVYFDFAGYTDMAIGCGRLIGIRLPENFNSPFLKRNLQQFWANWHMSLTTWLTDYIYWPLARKIRRVGKLKRRPVTISNICIVITFIVCGLWHGDGLNFFLWGLYHGVGLAILNGYTYVEKKYFPMEWRKAINTNRYGYMLSLLITFQYVAFGFMLFACDIERQKWVINLLLQK